LLNFFSLHLILGGNKGMSMGQFPQCSPPEGHVFNGDALLFSCAFLN